MLRYFFISITLFISIQAFSQPFELENFGEVSANYFTLLSHDMKGGADGRAEFRWARPFAVAVVRIAAKKVFDTMGPADFGPSIFDCSDEGGLTPFDVNAKTCRQRHPGRSHDSGLNLDIGYFLKSLKGLHYAPDYAACSNHFEGSKDAYICLGPPDKLDVQRQALFYVVLFSIHLNSFKGHLIREVGIDSHVKTAVLDVVSRWLRQKKYGVTPRILQQMKERMASDPFEGWAYSHHHHTHLRFASIDPVGPFHHQVIKLLKQAIMADVSGQHPCTLRIKTYRGSRSIEVYCTKAFQLDTNKRLIKSRNWYGLQRVVLDVPHRSPRTFKVKLGNKQLSLKAPQVPFYSYYLLRPSNADFDYVYKDNRLVPVISNKVLPFITEVRFESSCDGRSIDIPMGGAKLKCNMGILRFYWCKRRSFIIGVIHPTGQ